MSIKKEGGKERLKEQKKTREEKLFSKDISVENANL